MTANLIIFNSWMVLNHHSWHFWEIRTFINIWVQSEGLNFPKHPFFLGSIFRVPCWVPYEYDPSPPSQVISLVKPQRWSPSPVRPQKKHPLEKACGRIFQLFWIRGCFCRMNWMCQCFNWIIPIFWMCWWGLEWSPKKALAHPVHRIDLAEWNHISPT